MSQFMLCKITHEFTDESCVKISNCKENKDFLIEISKIIFGEDICENIWVIINIDFLFTQAQRQIESQPFENTELYLLLSRIYDVCEIIVLWYGSDYQDLDKINNREHFFSTVKDSLYNSSCECYIYLERHVDLN